MAQIMTSVLAVLLLGGVVAPPLTLDEARALEVGLDLHAALASSASEYGEQSPVAPLETYVRSYRREEIDGQPRIIAVYVHDENERGRLELGPPKTGMYDGGCEMIEATFDPVSRQVLSIECNGVG